MKCVGISITKFGSLTSIPVDMPIQHNARIPKSAIFADFLETAGS